jgi:hypothetical protein
MATGLTAVERSLPGVLSVDGQLERQARRICGDGASRSQYAHAEAGG